MGIRSELDGILGLSRKFKDKTGPLFIEGLFNDTLISKQMFAFYLTGDSRLNYVDIGHYDPTAMKNSNELVWIQVQDTSLYWWQYIDAIRFGETDEVLDGANTAYAFSKPIPGIFDTGSAFVTFPRSVAVDIVGKMISGLRYTLDNDYVEFTCSQRHKFMSIYLLIKGQWLEMHPDDFVIRH